MNFFLWTFKVKKFKKNEKKNGVVGYLNSYTYFLIPYVLFVLVPVIFVSLFFNSLNCYIVIYVGMY